MAGYEFRLATAKEARNELPLYLKKKLLPFSLPDQRIQSDQVKPPFSLDDRPILMVNSCRDELNSVPCPAAFQSHRKVVGSPETSFGKELYQDSNHYAR